MREPWGCDAPAPSPVFVMSCPRCLVGGDAGCKVCGGRGTKLVYRCPASILRKEEGHSIRELAAAFDAGFLPGPGAYSQQSARFVEALRIYRREISLIEEERSKRRRPKDKPAAKKPKGRKRPKRR